MSVENKIREFLGKTTVAEAYPGFGKSKEEQSPMQGSSEKPTIQTLDKGAGADAAVKAGNATSLAAGSGPMDKTAPTQGSSNASPEIEDLGTDEPGNVASKKAKKMPGLPGHGAGNATNFTTMIDPASVVNQSTSKGNVYKEDSDLDEDENDFITEEEYDALSEEEQEQYEVISEISLEKKTAAYKGRLEREGENIGRVAPSDKLRNTMPKTVRTGEYINKKHGAAGKAAIKKADSDVGIKAMGTYKGNTSYRTINKEENDLTQGLFNLFASDEHLSEEFKTKAASLFEAVVSARVAELREQIEEEVAQKAAEIIEATTQDMTEKVDSYLNYVLESWLEENRVEVEHGLRTEITDDFISGLRNLFAEHYIEIPEEKFNVIGEMQESINTLELQLNNKIEESINLVTDLNSFKRENVVSFVTEGLAQTEIEKFKTLVEDVSFEDESSFAEKLNVIKESFFHKKTTADESYDEVMPDSINESSSSVMKYAQAISRTKFSK